MDREEKRKEAIKKAMEEKKRQNQEYEKSFLKSNRPAEGDMVQKRMGSDLFKGGNWNG